MMTKLKITWVCILFFVGGQLTAQNDDAQNQKDRFFSIGVHYGFSHTTMYAGSGVNNKPIPSGMGSSRGIQISARAISLFKGDLSANFGVTGFEGPTLHFFDDGLNDELIEYTITFNEPALWLNFRWAPKGELVPYFDYGLYYYGVPRENVLKIREVTTGEWIPTTNIDEYGTVLGTGFKYHKKGSRIQTTLGFERYRAFHFSQKNNMFDMTFSTYSIRFTASYLLF